MQPLRMEGLQMHVPVSSAQRLDAGLWLAAWQVRRPWWACSAARTCLQWASASA